MNSFAPHAIAVAACLIAATSHAQNAAPASDAPAAPATPMADMPKGDALTGSTFSTPTATPALNQAPSAPGAYDDLAGIGRRSFEQGEMILTEPVFGVPLRFENGLHIFASGLAGIGYNDNVVGTATNTVGSTVLSAQPRIVGEMKKAGDRYTLSYTGNYTRYTNSAADNFNNHRFQLAGDNYFSSRSRLGWSAGYVDQVDPRGSTNRAVSAEPDRWTAPVARGLYTYGAKGAQGRFEVEGALQNKRYQNNRVITEGYDVDTQAYSGRFFARVMPKTSAVFEVRHIKADYKLATSPYDNRDNRLLVGLTWEAAAKTTGSFKIGRQKKNFDLASMTDASRGTWEAAIRWEPLTYSTFDLITSRAAADSTGVGSYTNTTQTALVWNHQWAGYLSTRATLGALKSDFAGTDRSDSTRNVGLGVFYGLGSKYRAGLELVQTRRNSSIDAFDFTRNTTFLSLEGTL